MRPVRVHVQVDGDPVAVGERVVLVGGRRRGACAPVASRRRRARARRARSSAARRGRVPACARRSRRRSSPASSRTSAATASAPSPSTATGAAPHAAASSAEALLAVRSRDEDRRLAESAAARWSGRRTARTCDSLADRRAGSSAGSRAASCAAACSSQSGSSRSAPQDCARDGAPARLELDRDHAALLRRSERVRGVDAERDERVVALEALGRGLGGRRGGGEERVHAGPQAVASRPSRRDTKAAPAEKNVAAVSACADVSARYERLGSPGSNAVHDVVAAPCEREPQVRAHADGNAEGRAAGDRDRRPDRDHLGVAPAALQRASPGEEVARPRRGGEHRHLVAEPAKRDGGARRRARSPRAAATTRTA